MELNGWRVIGKCRIGHSDFRTLVDEAKELINILSHFAGVLTNRIHDVKAEVTRIAHARQDSHVEGAHRGFRCIGTQRRHLIDDFLDRLTVLAFTVPDVIELNRDEDPVWLTRRGQDIDTDDLHDVTDAGNLSNLGSEGFRKGHGPVRGSSRWQGS